ncbi:MAG: helix-turn-helix domain-containing protein, partial [Nocardioides sp.]
PWGGLQEIEHRPRRGWWRDGLLAVRPHYVQRVLEDLDAAGRRTARINRRLHQAPLAVPLGLATRVSGADPDLTSALLALSDGRTPVVETVLDLAEEPVAEEPVEEEPAVTVAEILAAHGVGTPDDAPTPWRLPDPRPALARLIGHLAERFDRSPTDVDELDRDDLEADPELVASQTPEPIRETAVPARAELQHDVPAELDRPDDETRAWDTLHGVVDLEQVPLLIDSYGPQAAAEPVIGPQFAAARAHLGLGVDQLADRTRIRPHVIEAIEVDDFSACGGDFYARGHLRTLARVLGVDVVPLLETYDARYADAPIDPRRVFEAELAGAGSIRSTRGGPNWSVLVAAVMALILCWSIARLVTAGPGHVPDRAILSGSGGPNHSAKGPKAQPVAVQLTAAGGGAHVVVRNGEGRVAYSGDLAYGQTHTVQVAPPVRIRSTDGSVTVRVAGQNRGRMGPAGRPVSASYVPQR